MDLKNAKKKKQLFTEEDEPNFDYGFYKDANGRIKRDYQINIEMIFENDPNIKGKLGYNEFSYDQEILEDIDTGKNLLHKGIVNNDFEPILMSYMEEAYKVNFVEKKVTSAVSAVCHRNKFNPVKDYLDKCHAKWDGKQRLKDIFHTFLGVEQTKVTALTTKLWFVGAVQKIYEPTKKMDFVLDLVGGQGSGKTTLLKKLAVEDIWYTDQFSDFKNKDYYSAMLRAWIVNDDELVATTNSSFEEVKKFVTSTTLSFRKPYDRRLTDYPKSFVLARTTNHKEYLKDKTGERRFLPLLAHPEQALMHPVTDLTRAMVDLFWGEAVHWFKNGATLELKRDEQALLEEHRNQFVYKDEIDSAIEKYMSLKIPRDFNSFEKYQKQEYVQDMLTTGTSSWGNPEVEREYIRTSDLAREALLVDNLSNQRKIANKIKFWLENNGWEKKSKRLTESSSPVEVYFPKYIVKKLKM